MKVYTKFPFQRCKDMTGKPPIQVRWIDTNKQDEINPKCRSRLVAKDFNRWADPDVNTATPPIDALRLMISIATTGSSIRGDQKKVMINDVAGSYFNAPSLVPTFVSICEEDFEEGDENRCGELLVSMYGERLAAQNWQRCYTQLLTVNGLKVTRTSTCIFRRQERDIDVIVHGDDFASVGSGEDLQLARTTLEQV